MTTIYGTDAFTAPPLSRAWMVAGLAFAFLVGVSLSIPLVNGLNHAPTGYEQMIGTVRSGQAESSIEKNIDGPCQNCAVSQERVPAQASPFVVDPPAAFRGSEGVEV